MKSSLEGKLAKRDDGLWGYIDKGMMKCLLGEWPTRVKDDLKRWLSIEMHMQLRKRYLILVRSDLGA
jgi:hypothetical protein